MQLTSLDYRLKLMHHVLMGKWGFESILNALCFETL